MTEAPRPTALDLPPADPPPEDIALLFAKCEAKLGLVPNVLLAHAFAPEKLRLFSTYYNELMLGESGLSKLEREMIALVVSSLNRCHYCIVAHGAAVRQLAGDPALGDTLAANWRAASLGPRERALCAFAEKLTLASATVEEADREALRGAGLSERDIWDAASVAGFFAMSNRLASAVGMRPNPDYHGMAR
jgi:uncharacterized peroxidase-related enzyme